MVQQVRKPNENALAQIGVSNRPCGEVVPGKWFIGIVKARHEKKIKEKLDTLGIESFVATRVTTRISPQGRKRKSEIVVIPQKIFIFCSDKEQRYVLDLHLGVLRFLVNRAGTKDRFGNSPLATISNKQLEDFQNLLNNSPAPVDFNEYCFAKGDKVRIKSGILKGVEGIASEDSQGKTKIFINIDGLGSASTEINTNIVEIIQ